MSIEDRDYFREDQARRMGGGYRPARPPVRPIQPAQISYLDEVLAATAQKPRGRPRRIGWLVVLAVAAGALAVVLAATVAHAETRQERELNKLMELHDARQLPDSSATRDLKYRLEQDLWRLQQGPVDHGSPSP